jgi:plastocyanin
MRLLPRLAVLAAIVFLPLSALAGDAPAVLEFIDGSVQPAELQVATAPTVTIVIRNKGTTAVEFESRALHLEKLLPAGAELSIVLNAPAPGRYDFFDDFHPDAGKGVIVVN